MYDGKTKPMTFKRALRIIIFVPLFFTIVDYGYIKADMIGTFDLALSMKKSITFLIIFFVFNILSNKISEKFLSKE